MEKQIDEIAYELYNIAPDEIMKILKKN